MGKQREDKAPMEEEAEQQEREEGEEEDEAQEQNGESSAESKQKPPKPNPHRDVGLKFRNYTPKDTVLRELKLPTPPLPSMVHEITVKLHQITVQQDDVLNLAPKKPNWDLKRDVEKKLDILEKRTQRALYEMLKEKLEKEEQSQ
ncbi:ATP-dependent RNA helicase [Balamuthia mandrillaris]